MANEEEKKSTGLFSGLSKISKNLGVIIALITATGFIGNWAINAVSEYQGYQTIKQEVTKIANIEKKLASAVDSLEHEIQHLQEFHQSGHDEWIVGVFVKNDKLMYKDEYGDDYRVLFSSDGRPYYIDEEGSSLWCW